MNAEKLVEHTYGPHIYMKLKLDDEEYEVDNYAGVDCSWEHYKTTADSNPELRNKVIEAFKKLY